MPSRYWKVFLKIFSADHFYHGRSPTAAQQRPNKMPQIVDGNSSGSKNVLIFPVSSQYKQQKTTTASIRCAALALDK
jgi:hypothetical protein